MRAIEFAAPRLEALSLCLLPGIDVLKGTPQTPV